MSDDNTGDPQPSTDTKNPFEAFRDHVKEVFDGDKGISSMNTIVKVVTHKFINEFIEPDLTMSPDTIEVELLRATNAAIAAQNKKLKKNGQPIAYSMHLQPSQIAEVAIHRHKITIIETTEHNSDENTNLIGVYINDPSDPRFGTYVTSEQTIERVIRTYNRELSVLAMRNVFSIIRAYAPRRARSSHRDLIAVGNGIFNYGLKDIVVYSRDGDPIVFPAKTLSEFTPELIFLAKSPVNLRTPEELAHNVGTPAQPLRHPTQESTDLYEWDVESWIRELSDDEGIPELLWQTLGAIIRPRVSWGKTAWFYSEYGNNGKGTLASLMRELTGPTGYASIPIADFGKDFMLEPLMRSSAIIVDENDVGTFIDKAANFKAIVTNDVILINRKFKVPVSYQFFGFMVQCLNELPRMKDKSGSLYRRQLFVPFKKSFTGVERRYIKNEYLKNPEVLEYVLWRVLSGYRFNEHNEPVPARIDPNTGEPELCYYVLDEPPATSELLIQYKEYNDPVREFWREFEESFVWDLLPMNFLWDLYQEWFKRTNPNGKSISLKSFTRELNVIVDEDGSLFQRTDSALRVNTRMDGTEPLIREYNLTNWMGKPEAKDIDIQCNFLRKDRYRGYLRR